MLINKLNFPYCVLIYYVLVYILLRNHHDYPPHYDSLIIGFVQKLERRVYMPLDIGIRLFEELVYKKMSLISTFASFSSFFSPLNFMCTYAFDNVCRIIKITQRIWGVEDCAWFLCLAPSMLGVTTAPIIGLRLWEEGFDGCKFQGWFKHSKNDITSWAITLLQHSKGNCSWWYAILIKNGH